MKVTTELTNAVKAFEGCLLTAYADSGGTLTIGYGHTGSDVKRGMTITEAEADRLLSQDLKTVCRQVDALGLTALRQTQLEALADFAFNLGIGSLRRSTLLRCIRQGKDTATITRQFMRWVYCDGKKLPGLVKRRHWEAVRYSE